MLLAFTIILLVAFLIMSYIGYKNNYTMEYIGYALSFISGIILIIELCFIGYAYITADAEKAKCEQTYEALQYKAKEVYARDEMGIMNKMYIDEIQIWNREIVWNKEMQDNIFFGVFIPNIYDELETIDLNSIEYNE